MLFEMPGAEEREQIRRVQLHPLRTPLGGDVDFATLARRHEVSGGDIRNAVLKAALAAAAEPGPDAAKRIHQRHFEGGIEDVIASRRVMRQSLFSPESPSLTGVGLLADESASRLLRYALAAGGAALIIAVIALIVALVK